jgi:hypothetical protein
MVCYLSWTQWVCVDGKGLTGAQELGGICYFREHYFFLEAISRPRGKGLFYKYAA